MVGDGFQNFFATQAKMHGFDHQRLDLPLQQVAAGAKCRVLGGSDDRADTGARFEKAFREQRGDDLMRGVGIDVLLSTKGSHRRKGIACTELAGDDRTLGRVDDLLEYGNAGPKLDAEWCHMRTITDSTVGVQAFISPLER